MCWSVPADIPGVARRGEQKCTTPEQAQRLEEHIRDLARQKIVEQQRKLYEEQKKAEERRATQIREAEERKRRLEEEKTKRLVAESAKRTEVQTRLLLEDSRRITEELRRALQGDQKIPVILPGDSAYQKIQAIAAGADPKKFAAPVTPQPRTPQQEMIERQLAAFAYGPAPPPSPNTQRVTPTPTLSGPAFAPSAAVRLQPYQPEPRQITLPPTAPAVTQPTAYSFKPTTFGTVQVFRDGKLVATTTPQLAAHQYGYRATTAPTPSPSTMLKQEPRLVATPGTTLVPYSPGQQIDSSRARNVLPYALMSRDVYGNTKGNLGTATNIRRVADWETVMLAGGVTPAQVKAFKALGFYAAVYRNDKTGEITIAFRGSDQVTDFATANYNARIAGAIQRVDPKYIDPQYEAAKTLTRIVKGKWTTAPSISLTGHSLGGCLATFAGVENGIRTVTTFNAARNVYCSTGNVPGQTNVIVAGDVVGDAATGQVVGRGQLPGQLYSVQTTSDQRGTLGLLGTHDINGIIGGLSDIARTQK